MPLRDNQASAAIRALDVISTVFHPVPDIPHTSFDDRAQQPAALVQPARRARTTMIDFAMLVPPDRSTGANRSARSQCSLAGHVASHQQPEYSPQQHPTTSRALSCHPSCATCRSESRRKEEEHSNEQRWRRRRDNSKRPASSTHSHSSGTAFLQQDIPP